MHNQLLLVRDLKVSVGDLPILTGVDLDVKVGEVHALMGANGSGKSSLAMTLMGDSRYKIQDSGSKIVFEGQDLLAMSVDERARAGLFVAWQNPLTIPGVTVFTLCKTAYEAQGNTIGSIVEFKNSIENLLEKVGLPRSYVSRGVNEGFSGGEKKRLELLQLMLLMPKLAILDEIDSGLDIDALKLVGSVVRDVSMQGTAVLLITHYKRLLEYVEPQYVHVMARGKIVETGGKNLVERIEKEGYTKSI